MKHRASLRGRSAGFWLGVGLVAEAPLVVAATLMPADIRAQVAAAAFGSTAGVALLVVTCVLIYFATAWAAVRLGIGH